MWQQCPLEAKVRLQLLLALWSSQERLGSRQLGQVFNPNLGSYARRKRKGKEKKSLPFLGVPVKKLFAVPVC